MIRVVLDDNRRDLPDQNRSIYLATGVPCKVEVKRKYRSKFTFTFTSDYKLIYAMSKEVV